MFKNKTNDRGFAAIIVLMVVISLILVVSLSITVIIVNEMRINKNLISSVQSYYSAESGIEDGLLRVMNSDYDYTATNNFDLGESAVSQNITQNGNLTTIESISSYHNNKRKVKTELIITTSDISFNYGVQIGEGGLTMDNGSFINGNLYSDGSVTGSGTITEDLIVATGMSLDGNGMWDTYNDDLIFGESGEPTDIAMSFIPTSTGILSQISFYIKKYGNPVDGTIRIVEDNAGSPSTITKATATFSASKIGLSYGWVNFSFSSPANLTAGNIYWIIVDVDSTISKYFYIGRGQWNDKSVSKYSDDWSSESWTADTMGDYEYKAWIGGVSTSVDGLTINGNAHAHEIKNCAIAGDARYQTILDSTVGGTEYPGTPDPPVVVLPISDSNIADWKADAVAYEILDSSLCSVSTDTTINGGKLTCLTGFRPAGGVTITLKGTLWVEGDIILENNSKLILDSSYGDNGGIIIADNPGNEFTSGKILVENNIIICGSQGLNDTEDDCANSTGSYILVLSTHSGEATYAINVKNNANGAIFYAQNGTVNIKNGANLKEVTAYRLNLEENAEVTYESGLADASFSGGPGGGWIINNWNEIQ